MRLKMGGAGAGARLRGGGGLGGGRTSRARAAPAGRQATSAALTDSERAEFWRRFDEALPSEGAERVRAFAKCCRASSPPSRSSLAPHQQVSKQYFPGLTCKPQWSECAEWPWLQTVLAGTDVVKAELARAEQGQTAAFAKHASGAVSAYAGGWSSVPLRWEGSTVPGMAATFPETYALLRDAQPELGPRSIMIARQNPGTGIKPHSDLMNWMLTVHVCLTAPEDGDCWIRVGDDRLVWREGEAMAIDTSLEHETFNSGSSPRDVLVIDVFHPELTQTEREGIQLCYDMRARFEAECAAAKREAAAAAAAAEKEERRRRGKPLFGAFSAFSFGGARRA
mmetsp:Transcript_9874/g.32343  ORF Transcript_9874/g.32343 Transcript_9874/m.32343 type:complete len:338 (-) Transcript_9874:489-1502(-)